MEDAFRDRERQWRRERRIQNRIQSYSLNITKDGAFRIPELPPGDYRFNVAIWDPTDSMALATMNMLARYDETFTVPETENAVGTEPYDIGVFEIRVENPVAPDFSATRLDGSEFDLSDFRGRHVLLDFWATWCAPCLADLPYLRDAFERFGARKDFVMLSLSCDNDIVDAREFVEKQGIKWPQAYIGAYEDWGIPEYYKRGIPAIFLIDPEGKVVAEDIEAEDLRQSLDRILENPVF